MHTLAEDTHTHCFAQLQMLENWGATHSDDPNDNGDGP